MMELGLDCMDRNIRAWSQWSRLGYWYPQPAQNQNSEKSEKNQRQHVLVIVPVESKAGPSTRSITIALPGGPDPSLQGLQRQNSPGGLYDLSKRLSPVCAGVGWAGAGKSVADSNSCEVAEHLAANARDFPKLQSMKLTFNQLTHASMDKLSLCLNKITAVCA
jgi:hypothetical protein